MPEVLALIPARGGSKGIPRKNIIPLAGKPCLAYSIEHAQRAATVTRIIVSTEDAEIAAAAREYGAEVIDRPGEFAQDDSPDYDVFRHALTLLDEREKYRPALVVHLRPSTPVRRDGDINHAVGRMLRTDHATPGGDSLRSVSLAKQSPFKMWLPHGEFIMPVVDDSKAGRELHSLPRQVLQQAYHQNGYIDVIRWHTIMHLRGMAGRAVVPLVVEHELFELDYPEDVARVEAELRRLWSEREQAGAAGYEYAHEPQRVHYAV